MPGDEGNDMGPMGLVLLIAFLILLIGIGVTN